MIAHANQPDSTFPNRRMRIARLRTTACNAQHSVNGVHTNEDDDRLDLCCQGEEGSHVFLGLAEPLALDTAGAHVDERRP